MTSLFDEITAAAPDDASRCAGSRSRSTASGVPPTSSRGCCSRTCCARGSGSPAPTPAATPPTAAPAPCCRRHAGEELHDARRPGRRPRGHHRRGPRHAERAGPGPGGLQGRARPAVRVLHAGDDARRQGAARPRTRTRPRTRSGGRCRATCAAAPATRTSSRRCCGPPPSSEGSSRDGHAGEPGARRDQDRRAGRQPQAGRGQPVHPRQGQLRRRHRAARHAAHGDPAQPAGARPDQVHRHQQGLGDPRRTPGAHRRDDGHPQPGLDADAVLRHPGGAGHRQGALPGPGGRLRHRRRPVHRQGRLRGDRRRVRAAAGDRQPDPGDGRGRAAHPRRQGEPARQRLLHVGGRRQGGHRPGVRRGRRRLQAQAALPALAPVADGVLRLDRRLRPVDAEADRLHDHPGAAHHPRRGGAGRRAARAHDPDRLRPTSAAASATRCRSTRATSCRSSPRSSPSGR